MATLYKSNGEVITDIEPANGKRFTLAELYKLLNCDTVERVFIRRPETIMIIDEKGKLRGRDINLKSTRIFHSCERMNIWDWIAGDALVCTDTQF